MQKHHLVALVVGALLLCASILHGSGGPILNETVQMAGAGSVVVIPPEQYEKSVEDVLAFVRGGKREDVISLALVEVRKKYPELKVKNLDLRDFSVRKDRRITPLADTPDSIVVYFKDRSVSQVSEVREGVTLVREQLYRVEFVLLDGMEAVYVEMSPPPTGLSDILQDQKKRDGKYPPRPSRSMQPRG